MYGSISTEMNNAHDSQGHGSHTLSTASGNFVPGVTVNGVGKGTAKGASPRARVAAYKVCWPPFFLRDECDESVIMKGFEAAIHDGVDVLSISLGGYSSEFMDDALAVASFHALKKVASGPSLSKSSVIWPEWRVKNIHPDWSPSAIKSALMTTAKVKDNTGHAMLDESKRAANPFSRGAGDIWPNKAMNPGLVYDLCLKDYLDYLCARGYNETVIQKTATFTSKLTNVGTPIENPAGISVNVNLKVLTFSKKGDV
ncbi:subtilisin-like protease SBT5.4 [Tanacetum coccineum]